MNTQTFCNFSTAYDHEVSQGSARFKQETFGISAA